MDAAFDIIWCLNLDSDNDKGKMPADGLEPFQDPEDNFSISVPAGMHDLVSSSLTAWTNMVSEPYAKFSGYQ